MFYGNSIVHEQMLQEAMERGRIRAESRHKKSKKLPASYQRPTDHSEGEELTVRDLCGFSTNQRNSVLASHCCGEA